MFDLFNRGALKAERAYSDWLLPELMRAEQRLAKARWELAGLEPSKVSGLRKQLEEQAEMIRKQRNIIAEYEADTWRSRPR